MVHATYQVYLRGEKLARMFMVVHELMVFDVGRATHLTFFVLTSLSKLNDLGIAGHADMCRCPFVTSNCLRCILFFRYLCMRLFEASLDLDCALGVELGSSR